MKTCISAAAIAATIALSGCATLEQSPQTAKLPVQYATMKVIESDDVTRADVMSQVERAREVLSATQEVSITDLTGGIDLSGLDAADRLLVSALLSQIEYAANEVDVIGDERRVRIETLLDWIEDAAAMYADIDS